MLYSFSDYIDNQVVRNAKGCEVRVSEDIVARYKHHENVESSLVRVVLCDYQAVQESKFVFVMAFSVTRDLFLQALSFASHRFVSLLLSTTIASVIAVTAVYEDRTCSINGFKGSTTFQSLVKSLYLNLNHVISEDFGLLVVDFSSLLTHFVMLSVSKSLYALKLDFRVWEIFLSGLFLDLSNMISALVFLPFDPDIEYISGRWFLIGNIDFILTRFACIKLLNVNLLGLTRISLLLLQLMIFRHLVIHQNIMYLLSFFTGLARHRFSNGRRPLSIHFTVASELSNWLSHQMLIL